MRGWARYPRAPRLESGEERRENRLAAIRSILRDIDYGAAAARFGLDGDMVRKLLYAMADAPQRELAATLNPDAIALMLGSYMPGRRSS